jgi:murein L,D-transpeptidase YcbB/YkuD
LIRTVHEADSHGLRPQDYHAESLTGFEAASGGSPEPATEAQELLLSDAFLHLARDLSAGAVDPQALDPEWARAAVPPDPVRALARVAGGDDPAEVLAELAPPHPEYAGLRAGLAALRAGSGRLDCPGLGEAPSIRPGDRDPRVPRLRACLMGESFAASGDPTRLDADLARALRAFQRRHGLDPDGVVGPRTRAALAMTRSQRIDQVRVNLERWRWQPRTRPARFVRVDVPHYRLRAFEAGQSEPTLEMRVVVGRADWPTPPLHSTITQLVLNPAWYVPHSIFVKEILPRARREPGYFVDEGFELRRMRQGFWRKVDPTGVDWALVDPERVWYRVRQPPGPRNPLGRIKFLFENPFAIYLHGTPGRADLERPVRVLSHGCVRVEDELALARFALAPDPSWTMDRLAAELATAREGELPLPEPVSLQILYLTAEADREGTLSFTPDPYGWDAPLLARLGPEARPR